MFFHSLQSHALTSALVLMLLPGQQQPPTPPPPDASKAPQVTFSSRTVLITVPVVVTDKKGQHITGLKQSDFTVEENGKARTIANFQEVITSGKPKKTPPPPFPLSNFAARTEGDSLTTIICLDLLNTPYLSQTNAREKLLKFLQAHIDDTGTMSLTVLTAKGLRLVHSFTTDPSVLIEATKLLESRTAWQDTAAISQLQDISSTSAFDQTLSANPTAGQLQQAEAAALAQAVAQTADAQFVYQQQRQATYDTLSAMEELAQSAAGIPGRKSLIWVSGGLPFTLIDPIGMTGIDTTMYDDYQRTWQALNDANVSVYPIDANGLLAEGVDMQNRLPQSNTTPGFGSKRPGAPSFNISNTRNLQDSLRQFAYATGGEPCVNRNDLDECARLAIQDSSQYYMLAYYLPSDERKPGWRKLKVKVSAPHKEVRARNAVYVGEGKADDPHDTEHQFEIVFSSPLDYTAVPLGLKFGGVTPGENGARKVAFTVFLQPNGFTTEDNWIKLNLHFVATDAKDTSILVFSKRFLAHLKPGAVTDLMQNGFSYNGEMNLSPGRYQMKLLVRDDLNAKFGSIETPLLVK